jgi:hypothetical protein
VGLVTQPGAGAASSVASARTPSVPPAATAAASVGSARTNMPGMSTRDHGSKIRVATWGTTRTPGPFRGTVSSRMSYPMPRSNQRSNTGPTTTGRPPAVAGRTCQSMSAMRSARSWLSDGGTIANRPGPVALRSAAAIARSSASAQT